MVQKGIATEKKTLEDKNSAQPSLCTNIYIYGHYLFHFGCEVFVKSRSVPLLGRLDNAK